MSDNDKTLNEIVSTLISERKRDYRNRVLFRVFVIVLFLLFLFLAPLAKNINFQLAKI